MNCRKKEERIEGEKMEFFFGKSSITPKNREIYKNTLKKIEE